jgi:hypothetical protein
MQNHNASLTCTGIFVLDLSLKGELRNYTDIAASIALIQRRRYDFFEAKLVAVYETCVHSQRTPSIPHQ